MFPVRGVHGTATSILPPMRYSFCVRNRIPPRETSSHVTISSLNNALRMHAVMAVFTRRSLRRFAKVSLEVSDEGAFSFGGAISFGGVTPSAVCVQWRIPLHDGQERRNEWLE